MKILTYPETKEKKEHKTDLTEINHFEMMNEGLQSNISLNLGDHLSISRRFSNSDATHHVNTLEIVEDSQCSTLPCSPLLKPNQSQQSLLPFAPNNNDGFSDALIIIPESSVGTIRPKVNCISRNNGTSVPRMDMDAIEIDNLSPPVESTGLKLDTSSVETEQEPLSIWTKIRKNNK